MRYPETVVIMPVHNREKITLECLNYLDKQTFPHKTIVILDNCTDNTEKLIKKNYPDIILIKTTKSIYWTKSMQKGIEYCQENLQNTKYVISLNDDVSFEKEYVEKLVKSIGERKNSVISSNCYNHYNKKELFYSKIKINWKKYQIKHFSKRYKGYVKNDVLPGRGTIFEFKDIIKIGGYNFKKFPQYFGDYDITSRLKKRGINLLTNNKIKIYGKREMTVDIGRKKENIKLIEALKFLFSYTPLNLMHNFKFIKIHCPKEYKRKAFFSMLKKIYNQTLSKVRF